jgi:hypothetical protein
LESYAGSPAGAGSLEMQYVDRACGRIDAQLVRRAAAHMVRIRGNVKARSHS